VRQPNSIAACDSIDATETLFADFLFASFGLGGEQIANQAGSGEEHEMRPGKEGWFGVIPN
jgi:L-2-hydroxyglutarate oxidase LhgO